MTTTYRVVVVREGHAGFTGASGLYATREQAQREMCEIARTWIGLAEPQWDQFELTGFTVRPKGMPVHTYSILAERDHDLITETDVTDSEEPNPFDNYWDDWRDYE